MIYPHTTTHMVIQKDFTIIDKNAYSNPFPPSSIMLWNSLPEDVVILSDFNLFKQRITEFYFS